MTAGRLRPFTLPLRREGDAAIVDKNSKTVLVIDPDRDLEDDEATRIANHVFNCLSASPAPEGGAVPDDVRRLVIAARNVAFDTPTQSELRALDIASEAFASRVPWKDEPEAIATREEAPAEAEEVEAWLIEHPTKKRRVVDARKHDASSDDFWISPEAKSEYTITPLRAQPQAREAEAEERLLRPAGSKPPRCYCPPDRCDAPVIMGRQTPCIRARSSAPEAEQKGGA